MGNFLLGAYPAVWRCINLSFIVAAASEDNDDDWILASFVPFWSRTRHDKKQKQKNNNRLSIDFSVVVVFQALHHHHVVCVCVVREEKEVECPPTLHQLLSVVWYPTQLRHRIRSAGSPWHWSVSWVLLCWFRSMRLRGVAPLKEASSACSSSLPPFAVVVKIALLLLFLRGWTLSLCLSATTEQHLSPSKHKNCHSSPFDET